MRILSKSFSELTEHQRKPHLVEFHELTKKRNNDNDDVAGSSGRIDGKTTKTAVCYDVPQCTPTVI